MTERKNPIAVFDSGIGGISVLRELIAVMPNEHFIFLGDSANAPYGTRTLDEVRELTARNVSTLIDEGAKEIVLACNTATSAAAKQLRAEFPNLPIIGIEPALKPAVLAKPNSSVVVMATPLTLREEKFHLLLNRYTDQANIHLLPCPGLVELVERGILDGAQLDSFLAELIRPLQNTPVDSVVLGCTHYPHVRAAIQKAFGPRVRLFDGGNGTAREARRQRALRGLLSPDGNGSVELRFTKDHDRMSDLANRLLSRP